MREFIELPFRLHANEEQWIPPLRIERRLFLNPRSNAFFKHGEAGLFLARRDGRVVGRISAQIDTAFNDFHDNAWGMFGFLELEDDPEVRAGAARRGGGLAPPARARPDGRADGLHDERRERRADRGVRARADDPPGWHPPYYQRLCEEAGLEKAVDAFMWQLHIVGRDKVMPIIWDLAEKLEPKHGIRIRKMSRLHLRRDLDAFARDLQRGVVAQLGVRAVLEGGPRRVRAGAPARLRPRLVHDRRGRRGEDGRDGDHGSGREPGAEADERPAAAARLVALPAEEADDRPLPGRLSRRQARPTSTRASRRGCTPSTSTWPTPRA